MINYVTIGKLYGFDNISVKFSEFADVKVNWIRGYKTIQFEISDYLQDAPDFVIEDILYNVLDKIDGVRPKEFSPDTREYLLSSEFNNANIDSYLSRKMAGLEHGPVYCTCDCLVVECPALNGRCSPIFKVIFTDGMSDISEQIKNIEEGRANLGRPLQGVTA